MAFGFRDILDLHCYTSGTKKKKKVIYAIVLVVIWCIWKIGNNVVFNQVNPEITKVVEEAKSLSFLWVKNRSKEHGWNWNHWKAFNILM
ncbi:hypothetical protein HanIR_Chr11g0515981 [Helianthus annuus]|nr:hypothetical protein HanIR_Chr11g0515981 [Helianthus annuus]